MNKVTTIAVGCLAVLLMIGPAAIAGNGTTRGVGDASGALATASRAPAKPPRTVVPPPPEARILRQGGDTIADAIELPDLNYTTTGTTAGYTDDHDEACPYDGSTAPDVVYTFVVWGVTTTISIDMYHSQYDTKIYVYDEDLTLVACNDDYYDDYTSYIGSLEIQAGVRYYLVIDGYGGASGYYQASIWDHGSADVIECAFGSVLEGEPPLVEDYLDAHNGGCNSLGDLGHAPFQHIDSEWFCGQAGWYVCDSGTCRDTDWFTLTIPPAGVLEIIGDANQPTLMFELGPQECDQVGVLQSVSIGPFTEGTLIITGEPGSTVWFWVGPADFAPPGGDLPQEYTYLLHIPQVVAVAPTSWSDVKSLYR